MKPFWIFGIDRTVQNTVGAGPYGSFFALLNFSLLLNILLDAGITNYNNRNIARDPGSLGGVFSNIVAVKFLLALFYAIICFVAAIIFGYRGEQIYMLIFLVINQFLSSFLLYLRSNISGLHFFRTDSLISVLDRSIVIAICGVLLWTGITEQAFRIMWFVYAQTAAYVLSVFVAFLIVLHHAGTFIPRFSFNFLAGMLRDSYPFALLILLMTFYNRIDSVMLERMLPDGRVQAGIYAQSFRILDAAAMFAFLFAGLLLPIFSRMLKQKQPVGDILKLSYALIIIPAVFLAAIGLFYPGPIMEWLYIDHIQASSRIFPVLMFGFLAISTTYIFGTLLTANRNLKELNLLAMSALIINIVLNLILIPDFKALGAAIASLVTQSYMALAQVLISFIRIRPQIRIGFLIRLGRFVMPVFACAWGCSENISSWYTGILLTAVCSFLTGLLTGLMKFSDLSLLVHSSEE